MTASFRKSVTRSCGLRRKSRPLSSSLPLLVIATFIANLSGQLATAFLPIVARTTRCGRRVVEWTTSGFAPGKASSSSRLGALVNRHATAEKPDTYNSIGVRVGVMTVPGQRQDFAAAFERFNVTNNTFFQTEVPDAQQLPLSAKFLAMSQTVDVIVVAHGDVDERGKTELSRAYQTVALNTNVAIVPCDPSADLDAIADVALKMGEIRQQALFGDAARPSEFLGIGLNKSDAPAKKHNSKTKRIYF